MPKKQKKIEIGQFARAAEKLADTVRFVVDIAIGPDRRLTHAQTSAKIKLLEAEADAGAQDIAQRALIRLRNQEMRRQENIESIIEEAKVALLSTESVSDTPVSQDFVNQFFEASQDVSDKEIQTLWAKILAGEVSCPGSYAKRTLQVLRTMDKEEAIKFSEFCRFSFVTKEGWHYVGADSQTTKEITELLGNAAWINHFTSIGLLLPEAYLPTASSLTDFEFNYFDAKYLLKGPSKPEARSGLPVLELFFGMRAFSQVGQQLANVAGALPVNGYPERLSESLTKEIRVSLVLQSPKLNK